VDQRFTIGDELPTATVIN